MEKKEISKFKVIEIELTLRDMNYKDFAEKLNMSYAGVCRRMRKETDWQLEEMKKVAKLFNKSVDYLFEIDNSIEQVLN